MSMTRVAAVTDLSVQPEEAEGPTNASLVFCSAEATPDE